MTKRKQGLFISIDGPNGAGKSTFIRELSKCLSPRNALFFTREPSDTAFGRYVKCNEGSLSGLPCAYLICADRNTLKNLKQNIADIAEEIERLL